MLPLQILQNSRHLGHGAVHPPKVQSYACAVVRLALRYRHREPLQQMWSCMFHGSECGMLCNSLKPGPQC